MAERTEEQALFDEVINRRGLQLKDIINKPGTQFVFCNDILTGIHVEYLVINVANSFVGLKSGNICKFSDEDEIMQYDVVVI